MAASAAAPSGAPPAGKRPASSGREGDQMVITPLGAGSEVGRSCVHMTFKGRTVLVSALFLIHHPLPFSDSPLLQLTNAPLSVWPLVRRRL